MKNELSNKHVFCEKKERKFPLLTMAGKEEQLISQTTFESGYVYKYQRIFPKRRNSFLQVHQFVESVILISFLFT